jgi:hypothetical protein
MRPPNRNRGALPTLARDETVNCAEATQDISNTPRVMQNLAAASAPQVSSLERDPACLHNPRHTALTQAAIRCLRRGQSSSKLIRGRGGTKNATGDG